jgi:hypothetical protein
VDPLRDDPRKIAFAHGVEEPNAGVAEVIEIEQPGLDARHDRLQPALALEQGPLSQIFAVDRERVEDDEVRPVPPEHQVAELRPPIRTEADDFPVQHGMHRADAVRDPGSNRICELCDATFVSVADQPRAWLGPEYIGFVCGDCATAGPDR